jgi:hypothetical protein
VSGGCAADTTNHIFIYRTDPYCQGNGLILPPQAWFSVHPKNWGRFATLVP